MTPKKLVSVLSRVTVLFPHAHVEEVRWETQAGTYKPTLLRATNDEQSKHPWTQTQPASKYAPRSPCIVIRVHKGVLLSESETSFNMNDLSMLYTTVRL